MSIKLRVPLKLLYISAAKQRLDLKQCFTFSTIPDNDRTTKNTRLSSPTSSPTSSSPTSSPSASPSASPLGVPAKRQYVIFLPITKFFTRKYREAYTFYSEFVHLNEVRRVQGNVIKIQEQLKKNQDNRRAMSQELLTVRNELQNLHDKLTRCSRSDVQYFELLQKQIELLRVEKHTLEQFQIEDAAERDQFTYLTSAIRTSHEKERVYENTIKYWSIIGSIVCGLLGVLATVISYQYRQEKHQIVIDKIDTVKQDVCEKHQIVNDKIDTVKQDVCEKHQIVNDKIETVKQDNREIKKSMQELIELFKQNNQTTTSYLTAIPKYLWKKTNSIYRYFIPKTQS